MGNEEFFVTNLAHSKKSENKYYSQKQSSLKFGLILVFWADNFGFLDLKIVGNPELVRYVFQMWIIECPVFRSRL